MYYVEDECIIYYISRLYIIQFIVFLSGGFESMHVGNVEECFQNNGDVRPGCDCPGKERKVPKKPERNKNRDLDRDGLKELICSSDCVRGQGETRVTLISASLHLFISLSL